MKTVQLEYFSNICCVRTTLCGKMLGMCVRILRRRKKNLLQVLQVTLIKAITEVGVI